MQSSSNELVPSISIVNLVNQRQAVIERLESAATILREAAKIAEAAGIGMPRVSVGTTIGRGSGYDSVIADARLKMGYSREGKTIEQEAKEAADVSEIFRKGVDATAWQFLMHESGLRSLMDATAREKWDKAISAGDIPEITEPNIRSTFKMLHDGRGEMFERGVIAVFKSLAWCYKTNLPQKFGKRIVIRYIRSQIMPGRWGSSSSGMSLGSPTYSNCDKLDDLTRVFSVLDGKVEPDSGRGGWYHKMHAQNRLDEPLPEDAYLSVKSFRNGNGHITFKRADLVDKMNKILARHYPGALPAPK